MTAINDANPVDLHATALAFAQTQWPLSLAALRPSFVRAAIEYVADWAARAAERDPRFDPQSVQTVFKSTLVAEGNEWALDEPLLCYQGLYDTDLGHDTETDIGYSWLTSIAEHMLSQPGSQPLIDWATAQLSLPNPWSETIVEAVAEDAGSGLDLESLDWEARADVINEVGLYSLAQITAFDNGRAGRALASEREDDRIRAIVLAQRQRDAHLFFEVHRTEFFSAVGVHGRKLVGSDFPAVILAARSLRWGQDKRALFREGAPLGTFSNTVALRFVAKQLK